MPFVTARLSSKGGREANEDYCAFVETGTAGCWVVADGLGGHQAGETASQLASEAVLNSFRADSRVSTKALIRHFQAALKAVTARQQGQPDSADMRTTLAVLLSDAKNVIWGHVGDTRLYYLEGGRVIFQTKDHSVPQSLANAGEISPESIRHHPDRNRLLRSLGGTADAQPEVPQETQRLHRGDAFLLCTDGFWEFVTESEMEVDLTKARSPEEWLANMESRLAERAPEGNDNYTALAVFFDSPTAPPAPASPRQLQTSSQPRSRRRTKLIAVIGLVTLLLLSAVYLFWKPPKILREKLASISFRKSSTESSAPITCSAAQSAHQHKVFILKPNTQPLSYDTIRDAIDKASDGEEICISSGNYPGGIAVDKKLSFFGAGSDQTVIELPGDQSLVFKNVGASLKNLRIIGTGLQPVIQISGTSTVDIQDSQIMGKDCLIEIGDNASLTLQHNLYGEARHIVCNRQNKNMADQMKPKDAKAQPVLASPNTKADNARKRSVKPPKK